MEVIVSKWRLLVMAKLFKKGLILALSLFSLSGVFAASGGDEDDEFSGLPQAQAARLRLEKQQREEAARRAAGSGIKDFQRSGVVRSMRAREDRKMYTEAELKAQQQKRLEGKGLAGRTTRKRDDKFRGSWGVSVGDGTALTPISVKKANVSAADRANVDALVKSAGNALFAQPAAVGDTTERFPEFRHTCDLTQAFAQAQMDALMDLLIKNLTLLKNEKGYQDGGQALYCLTDGDAHHMQTDIVPLTGIAIRAANNVHIQNYLAKIAQYLPLVVKILRTRGWAYDQLYREAAAGQIVLLGAAEGYDDGSAEKASLLALADLYGEVAGQLEKAQAEDLTRGKATGVFGDSDAADRDVHLLAIKAMAEKRLGEGMIPFSIGDQPKDLSEAKAAASKAAAVKAKQEAYVVPADAVDSEDTRAGAFARFKELDKGAVASTPGGSTKPAKKTPPAPAPKPIKPVVAEPADVDDEETAVAPAAASGGVTGRKPGRKRRTFKTVVQPAAQDEMQAPEEEPAVAPADHDAGDADTEEDDAQAVPVGPVVKKVVKGKRRPFKPAEPALSEDEEDEGAEEPAPAPKTPSPAPSPAPEPAPSPVPTASEDEEEEPAPAPAPSASAQPDSWNISTGFETDNEDE